MTARPLMECRRITTGYGPDRSVLKDCSFTLRAGDRIGLVGANGAGKSTLLEVLVGLHRPEGGIIWAFGRERRSEADFVEVRQRAGLLFEDPDDQLFCITVAEDCAFGPFNLGWPRERVGGAVRDTHRLA